MRKLWLRLAGGSLLRRWIVVVPTLAVVVLALAFTQSTGAAPAPQPRTVASAALVAEQHPPCQSCHPDEYEAWKDTVHANASLDPVFQEQLAQSHNQQTCLACHTTGFDTGSGEFLSAGVTCEACHGPYKPGHPAAETMQLPMASETCRMCHLSTFEQWEHSQHADRSIECFDCHMAHTQGLRTGSEEKLCSACHPERQTEFAHATHGISGLNCASCHMFAEAGGTATSGQAAVANHNFKVAADTCAQCHQDTIHVSNKLPQLRETVAELDTNQLQEKAARVPELEQNVNDLQSRIKSLRDVAVVSMGLALGVGGFIGLLVGILGMALWGKRRSA